MSVDLISFYSCLCDRTRLRILNLLAKGPLCVCHVQTILGDSQVKISKHLAYLKQHGLVEVTREANWRIYRLPAKPSAALRSNLACLQDCVHEEPVFRRDLAALKALQATIEADGPACCSPRLVRAESRR